MDKNTLREKYFNDGRNFYFILYPVNFVQAKQSKARSFLSLIAHFRSQNIFTQSARAAEGKETKQRVEGEKLPPRKLDEEAFSLVLKPLFLHVSHFSLSKRKILTNEERKTCSIYITTATRVKKCFIQFSAEQFWIIAITTETYIIFFQRALRWRGDKTLVLRFREDV